METNPDVEFDHYLAEKLSMTVADLRRRMSNAEWTAWGVFYARRNQRREIAQAGG